jgi:hypothetical protein
MLAEGKVDLSVYSSGGAAGKKGGAAKGKMKENEQNVKNREREVVFGRMIER